MSLFIHMILIQLFFKTVRRSYAFHRSIKNASVLCFTMNVESIKKCFNYVIIILIQNAAFDTENACKENVTCVFVMGAVEYEMICWFCC